MVDYLEPNDAQTSATLLGLVNGWTGNYGLSIDPSGDEDWFEFQTSETGGYYDEVRISFDHYEGDLELALYDAGGNFIDSSTSTYGWESVSLEGLVAGTYYAQVYGYGGASNPYYDLSISAPFDDGVGFDDGYEENDSLEEASFLGTVASQIEIEELVILSYNPDWFEFTTTGTGGPDAAVEIGSPLSGDLDMVLYDANGYWLDSSGSASNEESISLAGLPQGTYYVEVYGYAGASNQNYTLTINPQTLATDQDDRFEENDTFEEATVLGSVTSLTEYDNLAIVSEDDDWFAFTTDGTGGAGAEVRLDFLHSLGDLDMALYDANSNWVGGSGSTSNSESITLEGRPAGTYYVEVYGWSGASNPDYTLTIDPRTGNGDGSDDSYEENDSLDEAADLGTLRGWNDYYNLVVLSEDDDWYQFTVPEGEQLDWVEINFIHANGDLDLELYDGSGNWIDGSYDTWDYEYIDGSYQDWGPGTYNVHVYGYAGDSNPSYNLYISTFPTDDPSDPSDPSDDDRYEDNDLFEAAASLGTLRGDNAYDDLALYDDDWFSFTIDGTGGFGDEVAIAVNQGFADLDLELYDEDYFYIDGSYSGSGDESVSLAGLSAGTYYAYVYGWGGDTTSDYSLTINAPDGSGDTGGDDRFEPNDSQETAYNLSEFGALQGYNFYNNLVISREEDELEESDWFRFDLAGTGLYSHEVRIDFSDYLGDLDLELYEADGTTWIDGSYSVSDGESVSLEGLSAGTYYAHVYGYNGAENEYTLTVDAPFGDGSGGGDDEYEENDSFEDAADLREVQGWQFYDDLVLEDDDWYAFEITDEGGYFDEVQINFAHYLGDIDMELYDAAYNYIDGSYSVTGTETISLDGLADGTYYLNVYGFAGATNPYYNLQIQAPEGDGNGGGDDRFEENDTAAEAWDLGVREGLNFIDNGAFLTALSDDDDWFQFEITETGEFGDFVTINFEDYFGDLDLELYEADGTTLIDGSYSITDDETVSLQGLEPGTYYTRIYGWNGAENDYTLTIAAPGTNVSQWDDRFEVNTAGEENDVRETATNLRELEGLNFYEELVISPPTGEEWEYDWYQFEMLGEGQAGDKVWIDFEHDWGDLDLELFDGDGFYIDGSYSISDGENISLAGLDAGTYYISVYGWAGQSNPNYTLAIEAPGSGGDGAIEPDSYEPNDSLGDATLVRNSDSITDLNIHAAGNDDWFEFELTETGWFNDVVVVDEFEHGEGDIDLELYSATGELLRSSNGIGNAETIYLNGLAPDTYYVRVFGYDDATNPEYRLTVAAPVGEGEAIVEPDEFEDNNTQQTAHNFESIREITEDDLTLTEGDTDWFQFSPLASGEVEVSLSFDHGAGDIDLQVYDENGLVGSSWSTTDSETVTFDGAEGNNYWVEVYGYEGVSNPNYSLSIVAGGGNGGQIDPDRNEPNDSSETATELRYVTGSQTDLSIHEVDDEDWFEFTTGESTRDHQISIEFDPTKDLTLELYNADGTSVESQISFEEDGLAGISLTDLAANTSYFARVSGTTPANYDLNLDAPQSNEGEVDDWTIMVYIAADNNLEGAGIDDINEMEAVNLPDNVNVVVQIDRIAGHNTSNGDWTDTRRGLIQHDNNTSLITSSLTSIGETNTGDPAALTEFMQWGAENYAAENYAVVVWDHGGGLSGVAWDDTDGSDNLSLSEVTTAIENAGLGDGLNLVGFDACLQALVEQSYELGDLTEVVVASQETEPGDGWDYEGWLQEVADGGGRLSPEEMGEAIVDSYGEFYQYWSGLQTQSAIGTEGMDDLTSAIDTFVEAVLDNATDSDWLSITQARAASTQFTNFNERDLGSFMDEVADRISGAIGEAAETVSEALDDVVIDQVDLPDVSGLNIYLPPIGGDIDGGYTETNYRFVADTRWEEFLTAFSDRDREQANSRSLRIEPDYAETSDMSGNNTGNLNNDAPNLAFHLGRLSGSGHELSDLSLHHDTDIDWYRFEMSGAGADGDAIRIVSEESGNLNLELYEGNANGSIARDGNGDPIQLATTSGSENVDLDLAGQGAGTYFIRVSGDANPDYTLQVDAPDNDSGEVPLDDLETSDGSADNDIREKAHDLGELRPGGLLAISGLTIHEEDVDWFEFTNTRTPERYPNALEINYDRGLGELALSVYDAEGNELEGVEAIDTSSGVSIGFPDTSGTFYIRVAGVDGATNPNYELNLTRRELDIDGNGEIDALSDGLMTLGNLFNLGGDQLASFQGEGAQLTFGDELEEYFEGANTMLDVDGNGVTDALTDGLITLAYAFDIRTGLTNYLGEGATRTTDEELVEYLEYYLPSEDRFRRTTQSDSEADEPTQEELWDEFTGLEWLDPAEDSDSEDSEAEEVPEDGDSEDSEAAEVPEDGDSEDSGSETDVLTGEAPEDPEDSGADDPLLDPTDESDDMDTLIANQSESDLTDDGVEVMEDSFPLVDADEESSISGVEFSSEAEDIDLLSTDTDESFDI